MMNTTYKTICPWGWCYGIANKAAACNWHVIWTLIGVPAISLLLQLFAKVLANLTDEPGGSSPDLHVGDLDKALSSWFCLGPAWPLLSSGEWMNRWKISLFLSLFPFSLPHSFSVTVAFKIINKPLEKTNVLALYFKEEGSQSFITCNTTSRFA